MELCYSKTFTLIDLLLCITLFVFLYLLRRAIYEGSISDVNRYFMLCKYNVYTLLFFAYCNFVCKFFVSEKRSMRHHTYLCGMKYVNMAVLIGLTASVPRVQDAIVSFRRNEINHMTLLDRFNDFDRLGKLHVGFTVLTNLFAYAGEKYQER